MTGCLPVVVGFLLGMAGAAIYLHFR